MKCRVIRDDMECWTEDPYFQGSVKDTDGNSQVVPKQVVINRKLETRLFWKLGAVIEHPEAFRAVQHGIAIPADDECRTAAHMSESQLAAAQHAFQRLKQGIRPEHFAAYDAGYLSGYRNGQWVPGPNGGERDWKVLIGEDEPCETELEAIDDV